MGRYSRRYDDGFQSALPRGERLADAWGKLQNIYISIRAPARGATGYYNMDCMDGIFQSALPRGERQLKSPGNTREKSFQSALPRGERRLRRLKKQQL